VLDFYCPRLRLAVELDGGQHNLPSEIQHDQRGDAWLAARGVAVLRFWNSDVIENMTGVLEKISLVTAELSQDEVTRAQRWRVAKKE
jgi:very-short-patch-repair endonuclease